MVKPGEYILKNNKLILFKEASDKMLKSSVLLNSKIDLSLYNILNKSIITEKKYYKCGFSDKAFNTPKNQLSIKVDFVDFMTLCKYITHSSAQFVNNDRKIALSKKFSGIIIDIDSGTTVDKFLESCKDLNLKFFLYTSKSNRVGDKGDRFHIFFPFVKSVDINDENRQFCKDFIVKFYKYLESNNINVDNKCKDLARLIISSNFHKNKNFISILNDNGEYLSICDEKINSFSVETVKTSVKSSKKSVDSRARYDYKDEEKKKRLTKEQKKKNALKVTNRREIKDKQEFLKKHFKSIIIDDRFVKRYDQTPQSRYIQALVRSLIVLLRKHYIISSDCRTISNDWFYAIILFNNTYTKAQPEFKKLVRLYKQSVFVESFDDNSITVAKNKVFFKKDEEDSENISMYEIVKLADIDKIVKIENYTRFTQKKFISLCVILYLARYTYAKGFDRKDIIGYMSRSTVANMFNITTKRISQIIENHYKVYYNEIISKDTDYLEVVKKRMSLNPQTNKKTGKIAHVLKYNDSYKNTNFVLYSSFGVKVALESDVFKMKNFVNINGKCKGRVRLLHPSSIEQKNYNNFTINSNKKVVCSLKGRKSIDKPINFEVVTDYEKKHTKQVFIYVSKNISINEKEVLYTNLVDNNYYKTMVIVDKDNKHFSETSKCIINHVGELSPNSNKHIQLTGCEYIGKHSDKSELVTLHENKDFLHISLKGKIFKLHKYKTSMYIKDKIKERINKKGGHVLYSKVCEIFRSKKE